MSNTDYMLEAVLRMPPNLWSGSEIDVMQRHSRYVQAAEELATLRQQLAEAKQENEALRFYEINSLCDEVETWRQQSLEAQCLLQQAKEGLQSAVSFQTTMEKLLLQLGYTAESLELDKLSKAQKALMAIDQSMKEE